MNKKDLQIGIKVYHNLMVRWGEGRLVKVDRNRDFCGFKKINIYVCKFANREDVATCKASDLRKTPNRKRIQNLEELTGKTYTK